ncbi:response regulator [Larkinella sp. VNQ87]|uniref:response regulator n=1 Tax=Larkinella sp. VNQ87 TaxID=3400921 RepID=UPI003C0AA527
MLPFKHKLIFLVDDDEDERFMLWRAFQKNHPACLLFTFSNGQELLDHLTAGYDIPDLIVLDLNMPVLDGVMTWKQLKLNSRFRSIPTVVLEPPFETSPGLQRENVRPDPLLAKPTTYRDLVQLTHRLCAG